MERYVRLRNLVDSTRAHLVAKCKASTKHLESRLEVIQGHAFWDRRTADDVLRNGITVFTV